MGTAAYMSPEQARGKPVDRATDIWAFGCLLYEMLAGRRPFGGETVTDTLATVLQAEPDWSGLPATTPRAVSQLVRRCLEKDQKRRLQAIGEARVLLEELTQVSASGRLIALDREIAPPPAAPRPGPRAAPAGGGRPRRPPARRHRRCGSSVPPPRSRSRGCPSTSLRPSSSPTGVRASRRSPCRPTAGGSCSPACRSGKAALYVRALDRPEATVVAGHRRRRQPVLLAGRPMGRLRGRRRDQEGLGRRRPGDHDRRPRLEEARPSSEATPSGGDVYGASWGEGDRIVFGRFADGLFEVSASGGVPRRLTKVEGQAGVFAHRLPQVLPGGRAILFTRCRNQAGDSDVAVLTEAGEERIVVESAADGRYLPTGHLVFFREGVLHAAAFDLGGSPSAARRRRSWKTSCRRREAGLPPATAARPSSAGRPPAPSRSRGAARSRCPRRARSGSIGADRRRPWACTTATTRGRAFPPTVGRIAVTHTTEGRRERTRIWVLDIARGAWSPLPGEGFSGPVWSPDGQRLFFRGLNPPGLYRARADGAGEPELLLAAAGSVQTGSTSPDGSVLAYVDRTPETNQDIWVLPLAAGGKPRPWLKTSASENQPELSPDGRWMAYASNVSGRVEVYVQPFPGPEGSRYQVSLAGGQSPRWSRDGRELFFVTDARPRRLLAADIHSAPAFTAEPPREVFSADVELPGGSAGYDVSPDGRRFLVLRDVETPDRAVTELQVVLNGFGLFAPAGRLNPG